MSVRNLTKQKMSLWRLPALYLILSSLFISVVPASAQELEAKININRSKVQGTDASVFENLQQTLEQFVNERQWTALQFQQNERISCTFNITVDKYVQADNRFECTAIIQANRPVFNSAYTTTIYNNTDKNFQFTFAQFDQLYYHRYQTTVFQLRDLRSVPSLFSFQCGCEEKGIRCAWQSEKALLFFWLAEVTGLPKFTR